MAGRLHALIAWVSPYEWLAIVLVGCPLGALLIAIFPPILGSVVVVACITTGTCLALLIGHLRQVPAEVSGHLAIKLALLLLFAGFMLDMHIIDFGCLDPGGVWDWNRMECQRE